MLIRGILANHKVLGNQIQTFNIDRSGYSSGVSTSGIFVKNTRYRDK